MCIQNIIEHLTIINSRVIHWMRCKFRENTPPVSAILGCLQSPPRFGYIRNCITYPTPSPAFSLHLGQGADYGWRLLKQKPSGGTLFFVEAVGAGEEGKASGLDQVQVGRGQPGSRKMRGGLEESVHQPASARGEEPVKFVQVGGFVVHAVETADVKCEIEGTGDAVEAGHIAYA